MAINSSSDPTVHQEVQGLAETIIIVKAKGEKSAYTTEHLVEMSHLKVALPSDLAGVGSTIINYQEFIRRKFLYSVPPPPKRI